MAEPELNQDQYRLKLKRYKKLQILSLGLSLARESARKALVNISEGCSDDATNRGYNRTLLTS